VTVDLRTDDHVLARLPWLHPAGRRKQAKRADGLHHVDLTDNLGEQPGLAQALGQARRATAAERRTGERLPEFGRRRAATANCLVDRPRGSRTGSRPGSSGETASAISGTGSSVPVRANVARCSAVSMTASIASLCAPASSGQEPSLVIRTSSPAPSTASSTSPCATTSMAATGRGRIDALELVEVVRHDPRRSEPAPVGEVVDRRDRVVSEDLPPCCVKRPRAGSR
jgi:hypothetical protein